MSSIRYRTNPESRLNGESDLSPKQLALLKERAAYEQSLDVKRMEKLPEGHSDRAALEEAKKNFDDARLFALIATRATKCSLDEIKDVRLTIAKEWLERLESGHLAVSEMLKECDTVLNAGAKSTLTKKERDEVSTKRASLAQRLVDLELAHEIASQEIDRLSRVNKTRSQKV